MSDSEDSETVELFYKDGTKAGTLDINSRYFGIANGRAYYLFFLSWEEIEKLKERVKEEKDE